MGTRALPAHKVTDNADGQDRERGCGFCGLPIWLAFVKRGPKKRLPDFSGPFAGQIPWDPVDLEARSNTY